MVQLLIEIVHIYSLRLRKVDKSIGPLVLLAVHACNYWVALVVSTGLCSLGIVNLILVGD